MPVTYVKTRAASASSARGLGGAMSTVLPVAVRSHLCGGRREIDGETGLEPATPGPPDYCLFLPAALNSR